MKRNLRFELKVRAHELLTYSKVVGRKEQKKRKKFILFASFRTGSTLLTRLIQSHPDIDCSDEIFLDFIHCKTLRKVLSPELFIKSFLVNSNKNIYGFNLKMYQLPIILITPLKSEETFIKNLSANGWEFILLQRENILRQALSNILAMKRRVWENKDNLPINRKKMIIDKNKLLSQLQWIKKLNSQEQQLIKDIPHLKLIYEKDLLYNENHGETMSKVFDFLGVENKDVSSNLKKVSAKKFSDDIENFEEIETFIKTTEYSEMLYQD